MLFAVFLVFGSLSCANSRPQSLFELAFQEVPKKVEPLDSLGATPADTFPLVLTPLNFAPAVVAPPAFLYPSTIRFPPSGIKSSVRGAIPLFAPLKHFPYIRYYPVRTTFYLSEPNLRDPDPQVNMVPFPTKLAAPQPAFSPIRDTQTSRRPQKPDLPHKRVTGSTESHREEQKGQHIVRVVPFPTDVIGEDPITFPTKLAAPQPSFSPIRDSQVFRKPEKVTTTHLIEPMDQQSIRVVDSPTDFEAYEDPALFSTKLIAAPRPSFSPIRDAQVSRIPEKVTSHLIEPMDQQSIREVDSPTDFEAYEDPALFSTKLIAAPRPSFSPIRDAQVSRIPEKVTSHLIEPMDQQSIREVDSPTDFEAYEDPALFSTKLIAAPRPSFSPIRDAQVSRIPEKVTSHLIEPMDQQSIREVDSPTDFEAYEDPALFSTKLIAAPRPSFSPIRDAQISRIPEKVVPETTKLHNHQSVQNEQAPLVRIVHFPNQIGPGPFETRDNPDIALSAPGGIVQSGQPHFTFEPFSNAKLSHNLLSQNKLEVRMENGDHGNLPSIIEV